MKRFQLFLVFACILVMLQIASEPAQAREAEPSEPYPGMPLCLPDAYIITPEDCLPLGPSQTLSEMAQMGMSYPPVLCL